MLSGTGMASGKYQSSVFGRITMKCFLEFFGRIPVDYFRAYSSGVFLVTSSGKLSSIGKKNGRIPVEC